MILTRPPELSGNPASRGIWERVGGMEEGVRILSNTIRVLLTRRKILRHGTFCFNSHPKEGVLRIFNALHRFGRV
jgi:hypothetical protein